MIAYESEHVEISPAIADAGKNKRFLSRLWAARGFFGGIAALSLALQGQFSLLNNNSDSALRYYVAAFVLLIASLLHPSTIRLARRKSIVLSSEAAAPISTLPVRSAAARNVPVAARPARSRAAVAVPLPTSRSHSYSPTALWGRYKVLRARLGWRATALGLALTAVLVGVSFTQLNSNVGSIQGGWLWFLYLLALLLTFVGAEGWPRGNGLIPGPNSDFFARGITSLSPKLEAALVAAILLTALVARLYNLEYFPGIYGDEGERGLDGWGTVEGDGGPIFGYGWWSVPKLYAYLVGFMLRIFDRSMVGDRMLSVVSGMLCVWFVYKTGRLLWGPRVGLIAGALMAASPFALQISRQASESAPTQALWTAGFYFAFLALRYRRPLDWALAGTLWGFSLYFYASGKLIIGVIAAVLVYCLVRWRTLFFKRYALGFALMLLAFGLAFLPNLIFNVKEHWYNFTLRSQETSLFAPGVQQQVFGRFGVPYDRNWGFQPLAQNVMSHPGPWSQVMFNQVRVSTEVLYRAGDASLHYEIHEHLGSLLSPLLAALGLLGLVYGVWKIFDPRFGLINIWFWGGMLGVILTMDAPKIERMVGAWPALLLFPAIVLDRVAAGAWPLHPKLARRWAVVPILALVLFVGYDGYREYFVHYASLCPFCKSTLAGRYEQALGDDYRGYFLASGDNISFNYGSARFIKGDVEGYDINAPVERFPTTDKGKGLAFMVFPANAQYLPFLRSLYPGGKLEEIRGVDGVLYFTSYKVSKELLASLRTTTVVYTGSDGRIITRKEPNLGSAQDWSPPEGLAYPATVSWDGGLIAPAYTNYTLRIKGAPAQLTIDGRTLPVTPVGQTTAGAVTVIMAKGLHTVHLSGTLADAHSRIDLSWATNQSAAIPVSPSYLLQGSVGGFSVETAQGGNRVTLAAPDPFGNVVASGRRIYPTIGLREATEVFGTGSWTARFQGKIKTETSGFSYFEALVNGPVVLFIDGNAVINTVGNGFTPVNGTVNLEPGEHTFDMRTIWGGGPSPVEMQWATMGRLKQLITTSDSSQTPAVWLPGEVSTMKAPAAGFSLESDEGTNAVTPQAHFGVNDLKDPHGVAVDDKGNVYVGDSGNDRVVVFSATGKVLRQWGKPATPGKEQNPGPGAFSRITDLAIGQDGTVYVLDASSGVQAFTPDGQFKWGTGQQKFGMFSPNGIAVSADGNLLLADTGAGRVLKLSSKTGGPVREFRGVDRGDFAKLDQPLDVAAAGTDTYAIDLNMRVVRIAAAGNFTAEWPVTLGGDSGGSRMAFDTATGHIYISDPTRARWADLDLATGTVKYYGTRGTGDGKFSAPTGIAIGPGGLIYVLDRSNGVQVFAPGTSK